MVQDRTDALSGFIWSGPMVVLLFGAGLWLTLRTNLVQVRYFAAGVRRTFGRRGRGGSVADGDITPFQALMTALSATVGIGNIAGVGSAIASGGPGAVFWMWLTALLGMATKYAEAVLAVKYRVRMADGSMAGGPMYYCRYGLPSARFGMVLGAMFAVCGASVSLIGSGNMFQSQQIAEAAFKHFEVPMWLTGLVLSFAAGLVLLGGIRVIGRVAELLVPSMIVLYFLAAALVVLTHLSAVPAALELIVVSAFEPRAAFGGAVGISVREAVRFGVARGVLSNESGLGSAAIAHGAARTRHPVAQGSVAMMGTFIDTILVCTLTASVILISGAYTKAEFMAPSPAVVETTPSPAPDSNLEGANDAGPKVWLTSAALTVEAFNEGAPGWLRGRLGAVVALASLIFGFTTLMGWSYYGQICVQYLFGPRARFPYLIAFVVLVFCGPLFSGPFSRIVSNLGDLCNAATAFPNLIALAILSGVVRRATRKADLEGDLEAVEATPLDPSRGDGSTRR